MTEATLERGAEAEARSLAGPDGPAVNWTKVYLGFGGMVIGQFMAFLDIQIVASSLTQIQNGVGATADEMSWVQTIYLLAEVVVMPLTAYMTRLWGTRPFFLVSCFLFVLASIATGWSTTIEMMIVTRALQGLAAGAMIPPVFAMAMTIFPPKQRITANVIMSLIMTLAPTIGPTLGGHLTEWLSWRWLFFINVPPGLLAIFLVSRYGGFDKGDPSLAKGVDWIGVGVLTTFLLSMQYVLEEATGSWFADDKILWLSVTAAITGVIFVWRSLTISQPILSFKPFADRNFAIGTVLSVLNGVALMGGAFVVPLFLGQVLGYSSSQVGNTMLVSGLVMLVGSPLAGRVVGRVDPRFAIVIGLSIAAFGTLLGVRMNINWGYWEFAVLQIVRSGGMVLALIASIQMTVSTLPISMMKDASSLLNVLRNVGGAIGLAVCSSVMTERGAVHYSELAARINSGNVASLDMLEQLTAMMAQSGAADPEGAARKAFSLLLRQHAMVLGYDDAFAFLTVIAVLSVVFAFFVSPGRNRPPAGAAGAH